MHIGARPRSDLGLNSPGLGTEEPAGSRSLRISLKRRSKGLFLGPLTDAAVGLAVRSFVIEKVRQVKPPIQAEFRN